MLVTHLFIPPSPRLWYSAGQTGVFNAIASLHRVLRQRSWNPETSQDACSRVRQPPARLLACCVITGDLESRGSREKRWWGLEGCFSWNLTRKSSLSKRVLLSKSPPPPSDLYKLPLLSALFQMPSAPELFLMSLVLSEIWDLFIRTSCLLPVLVILFTSFILWRWGDFKDPQGCEACLV